MMIQMMFGKVSNDMTNLVLFSHHYQSTIHETFSSATVIHYQHDDFYSKDAHLKVADDEFALHGGIYRLIQHIEGDRYQHMYVIDSWKKSERAIAKLLGSYPVMIELTDDNLAKINQLSHLYMFYDSVLDALQSATFPSHILYGYGKYSEIAADFNATVGRILNEITHSMEDVFVQDVKSLF